MVCEPFEFSFCVFFLGTTSCIFDFYQSLQKQKDKKQLFFLLQVLANYQKRTIFAPQLEKLQLRLSDANANIIIAKIAQLVEHAALPQKIRHVPTLARGKMKKSFQFINKHILRK